MELWGASLAIWLLCAFVGASVGGSRKMGAGAGFACGLFLGPLGVLLAAFSERPGLLERVETRPQAAGWHPDPLGRFDSRWFDGDKWTQHVGRVAPDGSRSQFEDPL